jgi:hypothetical protein
VLTVIPLISGSYLAVGLLAVLLWGITGQDVWVREFFRIPAKLLLLALPAVEIWMILGALREFRPGQPLRTAWQWIALAAACNLTGIMLGQVVSTQWLSDVFDPILGGRLNIASIIRGAGFLLAGTVRFAFLTAALWRTLQTYRRSGLLASYKLVDWLVILAMGVYVAAEIAEVCHAIQRGKRPGIVEILSWPTDPLLWVALAEALLLYRSARQMGRSMIGSTWKAIGLGVFLVSAGDFALFVVRNGYVPWPWSVFEWYIWIPAAAAFAMAPAYQATATSRAQASAFLTNPHSC